MERPKRIYVSVPLDRHLDEQQRVLKHAILDKLRSEGLEPQEFQVSGLPLRSGFSAHWFKITSQQHDLRH